MSKQLITRPLNLRSYMQRPDLRFNSVPFLDVCIIVLFFALANSRFILASGVGIDFKELDLPQAGESLVAGRPTVGNFTMVSFRQDDIIMFEGGRYLLDRVERPLQRYVEQNGLEGSVLLIKLDRSVPTEQLLRLCEIARRAGFSGVQIAATDTSPTNEL